MTPIDRVRVRSKDLRTLGFAGNATQIEIRQAFKALAKKRHPDVEAGSTEEFQRIQEAYRRLSEQRLEQVRVPAKPSNVSRVQPSRQSRENFRVIDARFPEAVVASCRAGLDPSVIESARHVAIGSIRKGRHIVFVVPSDIAEGDNLVIVPCAEITEPKRFAPTSLCVPSEKVVNGMYAVPPEECADLFPGARTARIRFGR